MTDPLYRQTAYAYDAMSRRVGVSNPAIQATPLLAQSFTPDGLIGSLTDANGNTATFTPDGFDRLATTTYPGGSTEVLGYDFDGNVLSRKTRAGATVGFTYDTLNRLSTKAVPGEATVTYAYDQASHLIGVSDSSASMTAPASSASYSATYAYDQLNRPLAVNWSPAPAQTTPTATSASFTFAYDPTNRRIGQTATDNSWWSYPTTATNVSYTANSLNQYTAVGSVSPTYDGNGNLTYDGTFTYSYDAENRMISANGTGLTASYAYDAQGRRKSKTVNGTTTYFVTDASNREVLEYNGSSGAIANWYAYALGPNDVLNQMNVALGTRATLIPDIQGSFIGSLDASSGALTKYGYQAYGESGSPNTSFAYTGQRIDPETGLYYERARMFSTALGRFPQADPIGYRGGSNLYVYVNNDPLNLVDAPGLSPDSPEATNGWVASAQSWLQSNASTIIGYGTMAAGVAIGVAGVVLAPETGGASLGMELEAEALIAGGGAEELAPAAERAAQIATSLGNTQKFVTIGVTDTAEGLRIISSSENALRPAALNALQNGEIAVTGAGHAEVTGITAAADLGLTPIGTAASRPICPVCAQFLQNQSVPPLSPLR